MMNGNSHFGTLMYPLTLYAIIVYLGGSLLEQQIKLVYTN